MFLILYTSQESPLASQHVIYPLCKRVCKNFTSLSTPMESIGLPMQGLGPANLDFILYLIQVGFS